MSTLCTLVKALVAQHMTPTSDAACCVLAYSVMLYPFTPADNQLWIVLYISVHTEELPVAAYI